MCLCTVVIRGEGGFCGGVVLIGWLNPQSGGSRRSTADALKSSYLVDPASSHMLVSKIKPCKSKYKRTYTVKLQMAH